MIRKLIVTDGRGERELLLVGTLVVGRDPGCHLNDLDPLLSRRHAEFVVNAQGATIRDLNSRNGILVNGSKVPQHALKPGDVVQLGHLHVRYVEEAAAPSSNDVSRAHATTATGRAPTMAAVRPAAAAPPVIAREEDDPDATRTPGMTSRVAVPPAPDIERTQGVLADETRAPVGRPAVSPARTVSPTEAHLIADANLIVTEASPGCLDVMGERPETLIGGQLANAVACALTFVARGGGPAAITMSLAREASGRTISLTVTAGQTEQES